MDKAFALGQRDHRLFVSLKVEVLQAELAHLGTQLGSIGAAVAFAQRLDHIGHKDHHIQIAHLKCTQGVVPDGVYNLRLKLWELALYGLGAGKGVDDRPHELHILRWRDAELCHARRELLIGIELVPIMQQASHAGIVLVDVVDTRHLRGIIAHAVHMRQTLAAQARIDRRLVSSKTFFVLDHLWSSLWCCKKDTPARGLRAASSSHLPGEQCSPLRRYASNRRS